MEEYIPKKIVVSDNQRRPNDAGQVEAPLPDPLDDVLIRPVNAENEKELYQSYYDRIYPHVKNRKIRFEQLAAKTGLRQRRLRECLLYRLMPGQVMQLFGLKKGFCYVCENQLFRESTTEPLCLKCLHRVDRVLNGRDEEAEDLLLASDTIDVPEIITREDYEKLLNELHYYKSLVADDVPPPPPPAAMADAGGEQPPAGGNRREAAQQVNEILDILAMDDRDVEPLFESTACEDMEVFLKQAGQPLRHYGFKRMKDADGRR